MAQQRPIERRLWRTRIVADVPAEVAEGIERHLALVERYAPPWCREVHVVFQTKSDDDSDFRVTTTSSVEYLRAVLDFYPRWLDDNEEVRHKSMLHEMSHLLTAELYDLTAALVLQLAPDVKTKDLLMLLLKRAAESSAESIMYALVEAEAKGVE